MVEIQAIRYMTGEKLAEYNGHLYLIRVFRSYEREQEILKISFMIFVILNFLGISASFVIGQTISRVTLNPIRRITQTAERIGIEDLSRRIELTGPDDEVKELATTFNDMISRLEVSFRQQNQFVADASHELRTPISVIQGYANLLDRWGKKDPSVMQESIDSIKAETEHMAMLVKKLLFMAKAEQGRITLQLQLLKISSIAEEITKEMEMVGSHDVQLSVSGNDFIMGDYDLIKQLLWILIENAVKYSKTPKDTVWIDIRNEGAVLVSIKDHGVGIAKEDLPYIFERFYRADKSRSNKAPGTGLGLSIASWIVKHHDATINVNSEPGQGTEITLRFQEFKE
jgi:signal transduction histidine kinase